MLCYFTQAFLLCSQVEICPWIPSRKSIEVVKYCTTKSLSMKTEHLPNWLPYQLHVTESSMILRRCTEVLKHVSVRVVQNCKVMPKKLGLMQVFTVKFISRNVCGLLVSSMRVLWKHIRRSFKSVYPSARSSSDCFEQMYRFIFFLNFRFM
jgi:hypothetical protein